MVVTGVLVLGCLCPSHKIGGRSAKATDLGTLAEQEATRKPIETKSRFLASGRGPPGRQYDVGLTGSLAVRVAAETLPPASPAFRLTRWGAF